MARKAISKVKDITWIDGGNSRYSGQVIIGNTDDVGRIRSIIKRSEVPKEIRWLPHAGALYPELLAPDPEEEKLVENLSCAELMELSLQSATINQFVASIAAEYLRKILYREDILTWYTTIDTSTLSMKSMPITLTNLSLISGLQAKTG